MREHQFLFNQPAGPRDPSKSPEAGEQEKHKDAEWEIGGEKVKIDESYPMIVPPEPWPEPEPPEPDKGGGG